MHLMKWNFGSQCGLLYILPVDFPQSCLLSRIAFGNLVKKFRCIPE